MRSKEAIVLLSGGLDSATTLYWAKKKGFHCHCLIFDYSQRHRREIQSAKNIAKQLGCKYEVIKIDLPKKGSSLLDRKLKIPQRDNTITQKRKNAIPSTYVPARNIIFLSLALSYAEANNISSIFIGAHTQDYSGYPDCRKDFFSAFQKVILTGTKSASEKRKIKIYTPLINKTKAQIIKLGSRLGVPFELTWSCYQGKKYPCGKCQSCYFRLKGFQEAGLVDPLLS